MRSCGVRELKEHTSEVLRRVSETGEAIEITVRGRPVARLIPVPPDVDEIARSVEALRELDRVAEEIGAQVQGPVDVREIMHDIRREL